ncbi:MAG TPA: glycosyltransferase, partial [Longimicrobium sp.]
MAERISVAMCTWNGERYLPAQLDSIAAQTRLPDELVACDDGSTDGTVALLRAFAARAPFAVRVLVNERNLGSTRNFEQAIGLCRGEVVALADQDDAWPPEKLARFEAVFRARPGVGLVFSDGLVVDDALRPVGARLWESFGITPRMLRRISRGEAFSLLLSRNLVTGAAMAFRARAAEGALPVPEGTGRIHDGWIALVAAARAEVAALPEPLLLY